MRLKDENKPLDMHTTFKVHQCSLIRRPPWWTLGDVLLTVGPPHADCMPSSTEHDNDKVSISYWLEITCIRLAACKRAKEITPRDMLYILHDA